MSKEIKFGAEAREAIKKGIDKAHAAVAPTLGAVGMSAIIDWEGLDPVSSDDGITILKSLEFKDKYENIGLKMLRKAALRTSNEGGDGTATTTVLTHALVSAAFNEVGTESSKIQEVRERLQLGLADTLAKLKDLKRDITQEDVERIALISCLDADMAKLIAEIIKEVGVNGVVTVEKSAKIGYSKEIVKGARFDRGFLAPQFMNDFDTETCVLENPYVFLVDRKLSINEQIKPIMDSIQSTGNKSVLIICDDADGLALASLSRASKSVGVMMPNGQMAQGTWDLCVVKNPYGATRGKEFLQDIATLTGATVISEEAGMRLDQATVDLCGKAEKVVVTKDTCTIIGGKATDQLDIRVKALQNKIEESLSEYEKEMLKERLAMLTGGIGVIRVGTYTDIDFNSKKLKFENGIHAAQAALQEGILPGGGIALLLTAEKMQDSIFSQSLIAPFKQMKLNAGFDVALKGQPGENGIDFKTKAIVNMFDAGIVDPFKVTRLALESAVSIASTLITVETAIVEEKFEK